MMAMYPLLFIASGAAAMPIVMYAQSNDTATIETRDIPKKLIYYGGPLITKIEVQPIFYGSFKEKTKQDLADYYEFLGNSYYSEFISAEYSVPNQTIEFGPVLPSYTYTGTLKKSLEDSKETRQLLRNLVSKGILNPNNNSYYPIYLAPGINATQGPQTACVEFCGYHGTIDISDISDTKYLYYGVLPDQSGWCMGGCGDSEDPFDNLLSITAHEYAEAITDPAIGVATSLDSPLSWYLLSEGENGDICNLHFSSAITFTRL
ncbi:hypothetical protein BJ741DRAFT_278625 [Chytriomyces cf. hyalinus JEL632]|nr:hypothetical protein BJ741DRAFT_278625 [Chytriomyces cf. hyalinus JEL632]